MIVEQARDFATLNVIDMQTNLARAEALIERAIQCLGQPLSNADLLDY